jgi:hypothetical protein
VGVLEYWSIGVLEYWSIGVLEYWSVGVPPYGTPASALASNGQSSITRHEHDSGGKEILVHFVAMLTCLINRLDRNNRSFLDRARARYRS